MFKGSNATTFFVNKVLLTPFKVAIKYGKFTAPLLIILLVILAVKFNVLYDIQNEIGIHQEDYTYDKIIKIFIKFSIFILLFIYLFSIIRKAVKVGIVKTDHKYNVDFLGKVVNIGIFIALFTSLIDFVGIKISLLNFLIGATGIGIGFSLRKIISNIIAGLILIVEKSIQLGDLVKINGTMGFVKRIGFRNVIIETYNYEEVFIPNENLISYEVFNLSNNNHVVRVDVNVCVDYENDPKDIIEILTECGKQNPFIKTSEGVYCYLLNFGENGYEFTLCIYAEDIILKSAWEVKHETMMLIARRFRQHGIKFAYPKRDVVSPTKLINDNKASIL